MTFLKLIIRTANTVLNEVNKSLHVFSNDVALKEFHLLFILVEQTVFWICH